MLLLEVKPRDGWQVLSIAVEGSDDVYKESSGFGLGTNDQVASGMQKEQPSRDLEAREGGSTGIRKTAFGCSSVSCS